VAVDVAIVCATQRDLRPMIDAQTFREDLYYRLNGLAVRLPPLRERSDVKALAEHIVERESAPRRLALSAEVVELLEQARWPGNMRQLFNVLRSACAMAAGGHTIRREHLADDFLDEVRATQAAVRCAQAPVAAECPARPLGDIELEAIRAALDAAGGNISEAARRLGISRNTIYRRLRWNESPS
jgi:sigma-54 dependent transcriptional regulator, acetoin dehydrogenase operon transcriptional activator AcoR